MDTRTIVEHIIKTLEQNVRQTLDSVKIDHDTMQDMILAAIPEPEVRVEKIPAGGDSAALLESLQRIRAAENQKQIIAALVDELSSYVRACSLVILGKTPSLWIGPGMGLAEGQAIGSKKTSISIGNDSLVQKAIMDRAVIISSNLTATEKSIYESTGTQPPGRIACIPMSINGRVQGVLIADTEEPDFADTPLFSILTGVATVAVEQLPFREKIGFSNFCTIEELEPDAEEVADEQADQEDESPFEDISFEDTSPAEVTLEETEIEEPAPAMTGTEAASDPDEEPAEIDLGDEQFGGETLDDYARELESQLGEEIEEPGQTAESPESAKDAMQVDELESIEIPETEEDTSSIEFLDSPDETPDTLELNATSLNDSGLELADQPEEKPEEPSPAEPSLSPAEPEPEPEEPASVPEPAETTQEEEIPVLQEEQVSQPEESIPSEYYDTLNLAGYNLDDMDEDSRKHHEKAIRFARLLVSEIKLYNEEDVKAGRENGDILSRLKDDIQRSKLLYEQRISAEIRSNTNYFQDEMVRQLADGNPNLLK